MKLDTLFWKKYFSVYDTLNELIPYQELLKGITTLAQISPGDTILDLGCGTGNMIPFLEAEGAIVTGIDFSKEGIEVAKTKKLSATFIIQDITKPLPFSDNSFNKIISNNTLYTIASEKRQYVVKELTRILKQNGLVVLSNITTDFKPIEIYLNHIILSTKKYGVFRTIYRIIRLIVPTIKIFYYNTLIKRADTGGQYSFLDENQQRTLLESANLHFLEEKRLYANNAIVTVAKKL